MINVQDLLRHVPHFETFCSVERLHALVERLRADARFTIEIAGTSGDGSPIYHVRFGKGAVKAMFLGFPHPNEPIGGLTVFSLLSLLEQGHSTLLEADVEWHIVPCIDPDGAMLNEGWSQQPFTLENYLRNFHRQEIADQVESCFPIHYKRLAFDRLTREGQILMRLLERIRPDFYFSLHNAALGGGVWYCLTHPLDEECYEELYGLLDQQRVPLMENAPFEGIVAKFGKGVIEMISTTKWYDFIEKTSAMPEELIDMGAMASDYLQQLNPGAQTFVAELPYLKHPSDRSTQPIAQSQRQLELHLYADIKFVATVILEEWDQVKDDLNSNSPFYRQVLSGLISRKDRLPDGLPAWPEKTRDLLFSPIHARPATESDRFNSYLKHFFLLCQSYQFVRLLKVSAQTSAVQRATQRLETVFDGLLEGVDRNIDFSKFEVIDCDTLVKVHLGSGLIVLNAILERHAKAGAAGKAPASGTR